MAKKDGLDVPPLYVYSDVTEVPVPWRMLRGGYLNVRQVNWIMARAHKLGTWQKDPETGEVLHFLPDLGTARDEFVAAHELRDNQWAPREKDA